MRKYTMFVAAVLLSTVNIYGLLASLIVQPVTPAVIVSSLLVITLILYVELNKKRVLLRTCVKESFFMFASIILGQLYFTIMAFT